MARRVFAAAAAFAALATAASGADSFAVTTVSPTDGATVSGTISWEVSASQPLSSVPFYVDDALIATDSSSPFAIQLSTAAYVNGTRVQRAAAGEDARRPSRARPLPCHYDSSGNPVPCNYSLITGRVNSALPNGIPLGMIVPVFQTFGQEGKTTGSAGTQCSSTSCPAPQALDNHPELQAIMQARNS
jgi:hypothetical protein